MGRRAKYNKRADGRKSTSRTYTDFGLAHFSGKKYFYGKTDAEIDKAIETFEKSLMVERPENRMTMKKVADAWWEQKEKRLSPNSIQSFLTKCNQIIEHFGDMSIDEITTQQILQWLNVFAAQGYSQRAISDRRSVIKIIFDYALANGYILTNPCTSLPTVKGAPKVKRKPASDEDVAILEAHKRESLYTRLYYFLEYTGCRIGEACVLQEKDVDRENGKARIYKDLAFDGSNPIVKMSAKTDAGTRDIDLYDNVIEILPQYANPETYIFFPNGLPKRSQLQKEQARFKKELGITSTAHQFRHTYASIMHSAEIDVKDTQARMGHANISVTQDIYTEIEKQHNQKARNRANAYIMNERLGRDKKRCPNCGSTYISSSDGHIFTYCPDCGNLLKK